MTPGRRGLDAQVAAPLDRFLPTWQAREVHAITIDAQRAWVFQALRELTPRETPLFRLLMALRALPAALAGADRRGFAPDRSLLDQFLAAGFVLLSSVPDRELVVGAIASFWQLRGARRARFGTAAEFVAFDLPGYARAALALWVEDRGRRTLLRTETRVLATDPASRRAFGRYWAVVRLGSGLIRREWLAAAKRRAERRFSAGG